MNLPNRTRLSTSIWNTIRIQVFEQVNESHFSVLYSGNIGRPNAPINEIITALTIKEIHDWTFRELEGELDWHIGVQYACGLSIGEPSVTTKTLSNFIRNLREYEDETGINLFGIEFERLTRGQLDSFGVKGKIARTDSTFLDTNICDYNRLQLQIEAVKRVYRILHETDQQKVLSMYPDYIKYDADNYVYQVV